DPLGYFIASGLAHAHFAAGRFEQGIELADRALPDNPRQRTPKEGKTVALVNLWRLDEARAEVGPPLAMHPKYTIAQLRAWAPESVEFYAEALRQTGVPED